MTNQLPRMRTLAGAIEELKAIDPNTDFTLYALTRMVKQGRIPCIKSGAKRLINFDRLLQMLYESGEHTASQGYRNSNICAIV